MEQHFPTGQDCGPKREEEKIKKKKWSPAKPPAHYPGLLYVDGRAQTLGAFSDAFPGH